jgi:hypothetical protein
MDEAELRWFRPRMERFAEDHHVKLAVLAWPDAGGLARLLAADRRKAPRVLLAGAERAPAALAESSAFRRSPPCWASKLQDLAPRFTHGARGRAVAGKALALQRGRTRSASCSKAHVADAYAHWTTVRPSRHVAKEVNGF